MTECVGARYELDGAVAIPLPTPPGRAAGSIPLQTGALVERAAASIRAELVHIGDAAGG